MKNLFLITFVLISQVAISSPKVCNKLKKHKRLTAQLVDVLDGDTLKAKLVTAQDDSKNEEIFRIRLVGMDTPESHFRGKTQGFWADEATNFVNRLIPLGDKIEIHFSEEACDRYYRVLGIVTYKEVNLNKLLVRSGLAVSYCYNKMTTFCSEIAKLMEIAMREETGIHADNTEYPYDFRARVSGKSESPWVADMRTGERLPFEQKESIPAPWRLFLEK